VQFIFKPLHFGRREILGINLILGIIFLKGIYDLLSIFHRYLYYGYFMRIISMN